MTDPGLYERLMDDARKYDAGQHARSLLAPFRDVLLMQRVKFMSYEQMAATLTRHGIRISPAAVGSFCRRNFSKVEIEKLRRAGGGERPVAPSPPEGRPVSAPLQPGKRGPRIARDDF